MVSSFYRRKEWLEFRARCLARVGHRCERCAEEGILQVHHPEYDAGRLPWDYAPEACEVLCRECHAIEHGHIMPKDGWWIVHSDLDENEPSDPIPCARCGTDIRWHFTIYHSRWGEAVVGSECADILSLGPELAELKSFYLRRRTFVHSPLWRGSPSGCWRTYRGHFALVYGAEGNFRLKVDQKFGELTFPTQHDARMRAFEVIAQKCRREKRDESLVAGTTFGDSRL